MIFPYSYGRHSAPESSAIFCHFFVSFVRFPLKQFLCPQHIEVFETLHLGLRGARESICCN